MSAFQVPEAKRFEFQIPGSDALYTLPEMVDLPPEKLRAFQNAAKSSSEDPITLIELLKTIPDDDDDATRLVFDKMTTSQMIALITAWGEESQVELGES
jgi:hypothetical protein